MRFSPAATESTEKNTFITMKIMKGMKEKSV